MYELKYQASSLLNMPSPLEENRTLGPAFEYLSLPGRAAAGRVYPQRRGAEPRTPRPGVHPAWGLRPTPPYQLTSAGSGRGPAGGRHSDTRTTPGSIISSPPKASAANSPAVRAWAGMPALPVGPLEAAHARRVVLGRDVRGDQVAARGQRAEQGGDHAGPDRRRRPGSAGPRPA